MNKKELNQKLNDLEAEASKLRSLINEPEQRTPEAGDVWRDGSGHLLIVMRNGTVYQPHDGYVSESRLESYDSHSRDIYLGKFSEVYVKRDDVREALSIGNSVGHCFLAPGHVVTPRPHYIRSREALAKLGITAK